LLRVDPVRAVLVTKWRRRGIIAGQGGCCCGAAAASRRLEKQEVEREPENVLERALVLAGNPEERNQR
jgi:hypothetical protein